MGLIWLIEATLTENSVLETKILYAKYVQFFKNEIPMTF
jgi:hypothetical protein